MVRAGLTAEKTGATTEALKQVLSGIKVQTAPVNVGNSQYDELAPEDTINVTVGVFFDGTQNNRHNVEARLEHEKGPDGDQTIAGKYIFESGSSFENEYSNISRGEPFYVKKDEEKHKQFSIYIEGVGTENYKTDSYLLGVAQGKGDTGVPAKVKIGCEKTAEEIAQAIGGEFKKINMLTIDTYGFSRGAAAARHFIYKITKRKGQIKIRHPRGQSIKYKVDWGLLGEELDKKGIEVRSLRVRFVGLYDTVAAYGIGHDTDTKELNLNAISKAHHVFQIGAGDEHRANFRRTDIASAGIRGKEVLFPGVHSDIGGGYKDNSSEKLTVAKSNWLPKMRREREHLISQGWYAPNELVVNRQNGHLEATRDNISNKYSFIPLQCMAEYGMGKSVECDFDKLRDKYPIEKVLLITAKKELDGYITGARNKVTFENDEDMIKKLRHDYFHFSAHYMGRKLLFIYPNKPNFEDGVRVRQVNPG